MHRLKAMNPLHAEIEKCRHNLHSAALQDGHIGATACSSRFDESYHPVFIYKIGCRECRGSKKRVRHGPSLQKKRNLRSVINIFCRRDLAVYQQTTHDDFPPVEGS
jgi:hypothetical protein